MQIICIMIFEICKEYLENVMSKTLEMYWNKSLCIIYIQVKYKCVQMSSTLKAFTH